ncbi:hypothetical protein JX265_009323 [Neoarthrinium moseri]|uniref:DUF7896 domain-containing protein n=1 Tax=Neoarthrinium moseri TaxID=1658444 RepID=A0A9Q0ALA9_9PEZI|nr:uncharacterized protein JN550_012461 [Neoarthrinium moseri]KAI1841662.1 hypothetical protein JX266_012127 [Neoarthrinium moseri]KAI1858807.1 hypothetical protein JN550_012461 [Neoarthrinium moseri]KAI1861820.1 hypothetical protein JX265_009323 [Neoarthrinium moseri]
MALLSESQDAELQMLKKELDRECLARQAAEKQAQDAQQQLSFLQSGLGQQSPLPALSSPSISNLDAPSPVYAEFQLSNTSLTAIPFEQQDVLARRKSIPRSAGYGQGTLASHHSLPGTPPSSVLASQAVKQQRTMSHQTFPSHRHQMIRSQSNLSTQSSPFVFNGQITPPPKPNTAGHQPARSAAVRDFMSRDELANFGAAGQSLHRSQSVRVRRRPDMASMPPVAESQLMDPETYFANFDAYEYPSNSAYLSSSMPTDQLHLSPDMPVYGMSNASVCGSMTTGLTPETAPMTRENSSVFDNQSVGGAMHMMQLGSHQGTDMSQLDSPFYPNASSGYNSPLAKSASPSEEDLKGVGTSLSQSYLNPYGHPAPPGGVLMSQDMSRSASNTSAASIKSTSSLKLRLKESLRRQNQHTALLKPKPSSDAKATDSHSAKKDGKTAITKAKYVRPRQPKVFCEKCTEHPDGFRGEHELRRHRDAKHPEQGVIKKWICVDPATRGLPIGVAVVNPLDKCKACKAQKKYGAYYNAAAHLRRTHFKEKPSRAKNKNNGASSRPDDDKRGGKGGGDWPPMTELKNWMKEVWVHKDELKQDSDEENEEDAGADSSANDMDIDLEHGAGQLAPDYTMPMHSGNDNMVAEMGFGMYPNHLAINTEIPFYAHQPLISSAQFTDYACSPMIGTFPYTGPSQVSQYGSVVSSNDTITANAANFGEAMGNVGDLQFDEMMYPQ